MEPVQLCPVGTWDAIVLLFTMIFNRMVPFWPIITLRIVFLLCLNVSKQMGERTGPDSFDASDVTWAHAVNSREALERELAGSADFLEADVTLGFLRGSTFGSEIPIMAHPPDTLSDISLKMWLDTVMRRQAVKGIKLDFKNIDVVEKSFIELRKYAWKPNSSLWLNADILRGPIRSSSVPVHYGDFLLLCNQYFPDSVVSAGWTTEWFPTFPPDTWYYEWKKIVKMADVIRCFEFETHQPSFTFPMRGIYAARSIKQLRWLLSVVPGSTLTVWSSRLDPLDIDDLINIRKSFPADKVYYDIPHPLHDSFSQIKNATPYEPEDETSFRNEQWMVLSRGISSICSHYTYISSDTVVFGQGLTTAVILKTLLHGDQDGGLEIEGRVRFFADYDDTSRTVPADNVLKLVLVDVSLFSKNSSSEGLDLTESDTDVLWSAVNASELYSFEQRVAQDCRMFRLDTDQEKVFQAWTVPCDPTYDHLPFKEVTKEGKREVSYGKRVVLPAGRFMVGFVSSGEGHSVLHDFVVRNKKDNIIDNSLSSSCIRTPSLVAMLSVLLLSIAFKILFI